MPGGQKVAGSNPVAPIYNLFQVNHLRKVVDFFLCARHVIELGGASPLRTRQGEPLARRQGCRSQGRIRRKPKAKRCSDEQKPDTRRLFRIRRQKPSKSDTCPEKTGVDQAGINAKVQEITRGGPYPAERLGPSRGGSIKIRKSAEGIVGRSTRPKAQTCETMNTEI